MKKLATITLASIALLVLLATGALATVISTQSGSWNSPATWGGSPIPTAADGVIIPTNLTVTVDVPTAVCLNIQLGSSTPGAGSGTLVFNAASRLTVSGLVTVGASNNKGSINMAGGGTLTCEGLVLQGVGTWTPGTGTVEFTASNTLPNNGITSFNNLTITGGTTTLNANTLVSGDLNIAPAASLDESLRVLTVTGNWINNGAFIGSTGTVIFNRNGNQTISGAGANNFNQVRLNMGLLSSNTLEVVATNFTAPDPFLTLSNGTFKVSGSFPLVNSFILGPIYNIPPTAGLWINNPNVTVTPQAGNVSVRGVLHLSAGTFNVGTVADNNLDYVGGSSFILDGGALNVAGHFGRNNATASANYNQSAGTVTVVTQGSTDLVFAGFDVGAAASTFTMSGGTIVIQGATSAPADYLVAASVSSVTGGTVQAGNAATPNAQTIRIQSPVPVGSLFVSNATAQATKPVAQLVTSSLNVVGGVTIQAGTGLNANGLNLSVGGDWLDSGTFTPGPTTTFNGSGPQGLVRAGGEAFNGLTINKPASTLTLNNSVTVNNTFSLTQGTLAVGANTLTLNSTVTGAGSVTSAPAGTVLYNQSSAGQGVLPAAYGNLTFSNFNKTLAPSGTIGISGVFTPGSAVGHTVAGSTVDFDGAGQGIPAFAYNNLVTSGSGTKTASGALTVGGNLANGAGILLSGATALNLNGATHANNGTLIAATVAVASGGTLTNSGSATVTSSLTGLGTLTQGPGSGLNLGGTADIATFNSSATGNTVNYTGASQTVRPSTYHHLVLSGSGSPGLAGVSLVNGDFTLSGSVTPVASNGMTVGGNFTVGSGTSFDAGAVAHDVKGNFSNAGGFTAGTSTFTFDGLGAQTLGAAVFSGLTLNNASGASLLGNLTVGGTLSLAAGPLAIGANTLTLNGAISLSTGSLVGGATSSLLVSGAGPGTTLPAISLANFTLNRAAGLSLGGDLSVAGTLTTTSGTLNTGANSAILGALATLSETAGQPILGTVTTTRNISATSGTVTFGNIGADVALNGVALGNTGVLRRTGTTSLGAGHSSITRYFDIAPATNTGLNAGLVLHYDATELNSQNAGILELFRSRDSGVSWNDLGGTASAVAHTITVTGLNDFSRWTASDSLNRIGSTATPTTASIAPTSKLAGDPAFTLTVNGTEFVGGKSTVRFNGSDRPTTYVNSTQLTASIPAGDLLATGPFPITVFSAAGGGTSNLQTFTVNPGPPALVRVETAADGSGTAVGAQSLASGSSIPVFAITRDAQNHFVANVAAGSWVLENITGGIIAGDLVPAVDARSAVFTAHVTGSTDIRATSGVLAATPSGTLTVTPGAAARVRVETAANGTGIVVPAQSLGSGASITVFSVARDASSNFVSNIAATSWSLQNSTGGVVAGDLVPAVDSKSAVFTGHAVGGANINAASGVLATTSSGAVTVTPGTAALVRVESAANGSGTLVPAQSLVSGSSVTGFAIARDASNNFVANVAATGWALQGVTGGVVAGDLVPAVDSKSAVFTGHRVGSAQMSASSGALPSTSSGVITVTPGAVATVRVETAANGTGTLVPAQSLASGSSITAFAISRDASGNFLSNVAATSWIAENITGGVVAGDLVPAVDSKSAVFTGHVIGSADIKATSGALTPVPSGAITVTAGPAAAVRVETAANGSGTVVPAQSLNTGGSITVYSVTRDASNNFVANVAASAWSLVNITGAVVAADLVPAADSKSAVFTAHAAGSSAIHAASGALAATNSGTITTTAITGVQDGKLVFALQQNRPNPFHRSTQVGFELAAGGNVSLFVYDASGRKVAELASGHRDAGHHTVTWDSVNERSGVYFARFTVTDGLGRVKFSKVTKMLLMR